jgi:hypothetical protein
MEEEEEEEEEEETDLLRTACTQAGRYSPAPTTSWERRLVLLLGLRQRRLRNL